MKELPYFRFTSQEWQNGMITLESMEDQGVFINACSYYWLSNCSITIAVLKQRLKGYEKSIDTLIEKEIIYDNGGNITIGFLDEQWGDLKEYREKKQIAGRKGGLKKSSNAKAQLKHNSSYKDKDKDKDKDNLEEFELFWNSYDKKTGKDKCLEKFLKLSNDHKQKIFETLPAYVKSTPDKKFRKNPLTYLNGKHWNDELEDKQNINPALKPDPLVEYAKKQQELYGNS